MVMVSIRQKVQCGGERHTVDSLHLYCKGSWGGIVPGKVADGPYRSEGGVEEAALKVEALALRHLIALVHSLHTVTCNMR
jgi:hypothetical protein